KRRHLAVPAILPAPHAGCHSSDRAARIDRAHLLFEARYSPMTPSNLLLTIVCVVGIAVGQILFKQAARASLPGAGLMVWVNGWLLAALVLYGGATLLWVYVLRTTPLALAYSVFALAFIIVPILSATFFGEPLRPSYFVGGALIIAGVYISTQGRW
ncbi:MAG: hypothetical protein ABI854_12690, partial [Betaproteobacteria bacterium]